MFQMRTLTALAIAAAGVAAAAVLPVALSAQETVPKPSPVHDMMLKGVGEWVGTLDSTYPGTPAMKVDATETVTALGAFHTVSDFRCEFMGMPYRGFGTTSYDAKTKMVLNTSTDNMNPSTSVMRGTIDLDSGVTNLAWAAPGPGGDLIPHRAVITASDNKYEMEFYMGEGDAEIRSMVISMTRKR